MLVLIKDINQEVAKIIGKKKSKTENFINKNKYRNIPVTNKKEISKEDYLFVLEYYKAKIKKQLEKEEIKKTKWDEFSEKIKFAQIELYSSPDWEILFLIQDILKVTIQEFYQEAPETVRKRLRVLRLI